MGLKVIQTGGLDKRTGIYQPEVVEWVEDEKSVFGRREIQDLLLEVLGTTRQCVPCYSTCSVGYDCIEISSRTGGQYSYCYNNAESYMKEFGEPAIEGQAWNDDLCALPAFLYRHDNWDHCDYSVFVFSVSEPFKPLVRLLSNFEHRGIPEDHQDRLEAMLKATENTDPANPEYARAMELANRIMEQWQRETKAASPSPMLPAPADG